MADIDRTDRKDRLYGTRQNDCLYGWAGNDFPRGGDGADTLDGGSGNDWADYITGADAGVTVSLVAGASNTGGHAEEDVLRNIESLWGSDHNDTLIGDAGNGRINGGPGTITLQAVPVLTSSQVPDTMTGGSGKDTSIFRAGHGNDVITDFSVETDKLAFFSAGSSVEFSDLTIGEWAQGTGTSVAWSGGAVYLEGVESASPTESDFLLSDRKFSEGEHWYKLTGRVLGHFEGTGDSDVILCAVIGCRGPV
ncbi:MAG: hypothetical protein GDA53_02480 [Rhodobacteraceae bacterium]|nr:hypothetical protein [Paracoccaceae bacterium]